MRPSTTLLAPILLVGLSACATSTPTPVGLEPNQCKSTNDCIAAANAVTDPTSAAGQAALKQDAWWLHAAEVEECSAAWAPQWWRLSALSWGLLAGQVALTAAVPIATAAQAATGTISALGTAAGTSGTLIGAAQKLVVPPAWGNATQKMVADTTTATKPSNLSSGDLVALRNLLDTECPTQPVLH
jgi:hypothetical protein